MKFSVVSKLLGTNNTVVCVSALLLLSCFFLACSGVESKLDTDKSKKIVWSDEFDYTGLPDSTKWSYDVGDGCDVPAGCGWGNNEAQFYTENAHKNARVENGYLIIEAHKEEIRNSKYTSARLVTKGKGDWKYGKIEVRAKLPEGLGTWPAIWMLSTDWEYGGWPESGEIDIMEHVGFMPDSILATVHTKAFNHLNHTQVGDSILINDAESKFHIYSLDWKPDHMDFYVDDALYFTFTNSQKTFREWPFDKRFHLILNIAVGGNWGGAHGIDDSIWPQKMMVDYVRVYDNGFKLSGEK